MVEVKRQKVMGLQEYPPHNLPDSIEKAIVLLEGYRAEMRKKHGSEIDIKIGLRQGTVPNTGERVGILQLICLRKETDVEKELKLLTDAEDACNGARNDKERYRRSRALAREAVAALKDCVLIKPNPKKLKI